MRGEQLAILARHAREAQRGFGRTVAAIAQMRKLGHVAVEEPAQQRRAFAIGHRRGIGGHRRLQHRPVGHGGAHIGHGGEQRGLKRLALPGIGALDLEIDDGLAPLAGGLVGIDFAQQSIGIAAQRHHRMDDPVDRQAEARDGGSDGIDQERHVVVDDRQPHVPVACLSRDRFDREHGIGRGTPRHRPKREIGGLLARLCVKSLVLARQCAFEKRVAQGLAKAFVLFGIGKRGAGRRVCIGRSILDVGHGFLVPRVRAGLPPLYGVCCPGLCAIARGFSSIQPGNHAKMT